MLHRYYQNAFCLMVVLLFIIVGIASAMSIPLVGGPCSYATYTGSATVTDLTATQNGYQLHFAAQFNAPHPRAGFYSPARYSVVFVSNPAGETTNDWLHQQGIFIGAVLELNLSLITSGTCSPVIQTFPAFSTIIQ